MMLMNVLEWWEYFQWKQTASVNNIMKWKQKDRCSEKTECEGMDELFEIGRNKSKK